MKNIVFTITLCFLFSGNLLAQELPKNQRYVWDDFSGGLNTKLSEYALPKNQGDICENLRLGTKLKSLNKRDEVFSYGSMDADEAGTSLHRLYLKDTTKKLLGTHGNELEVGDDSAGTFSSLISFLNGNYRWKWVTWNNVAIGSDGYNQPIKTDGTVATYLGSCAAADAGSGAGPDGTYNYKISYYTTSYEVILDQVSNNVTVSDNDINLTMIPIAPTTYGGETVAGRKVYRSDNNGTGTYNILSNGTIADNTTTTLTDSDADAACDAGAAYPAGDAEYTPPKGKIPVISNNRLWFANDPSHPSRIYYSEDGCPDIFIGSSGACTSYFNIRLDDGDEITFALNLLGQLCVGKNNSIQYIETHKGDSPTADWEVSDPCDFIGCDAIHTAVNSPLGIIYLDWSGLYKFNGNYSTLISDAVTPVIKDISESNFSNCAGIFHKNIYYLAYASEATGSPTNNRVLVFDLLTNAYSIDILSVNAFCTLSSGDDWDVLYSVSSEDGTVYAHSETVHGIIHSKHSDFDKAHPEGEAEWIGARYIPERWGGDSNSPTLEIANRTTINGLTGIINNLSGNIDRATDAGHYVSHVLECGASAFDKLYWHETMPATGGEVAFFIRTGADKGACQTASWSDPFSDPTGSDISHVDADTYLQYNIRMRTNDLDYTPTVYTVEGYTVKITYDTEGSTQESTVPFRWRSGWTDLGWPGYIKSLTRIYCYYSYTEGASGTLNLTFENFNGDMEEFAIDLRANPTSYTAAFTGGKFTGDLFRLDIDESSLNDLTIDKVICYYDVEYQRYVD